ncbi:MAG: P1 family peptidase [Rhodospirillales bacterium]|jgi:D-aminopeptidase|nr:P1 family peptidase [Rhodospirillales bacterium]
MADSQSRLPDGRPRGRGLGLPFPGKPGPDNAITDVEGVAVGYATLIEGEGAIEVGKGPVRTGVTAILPRTPWRPDASVRAGAFTLNGNGEMTGTHWINEAGYFATPVAITNTHSLGIAHHATVRWITRQFGDDLGAYNWALPVIAETSDAYLNDMNGLHVTEEHVLAALDGAASGPLCEGNVGGGTGMTCYEFKGGTGTASRLVPILGSDYTVGALVQANHGIRPWLTILGVPVGQHLTDGRFKAAESGSIVVVVATDAPLLSIQLQRLARRITIGLGRTGSVSGDSSGDIFLAFSTANADPHAGSGGLSRLEYIPNSRLDGMFLAVVESVEEAIVNALVAAETMIGRDNREVRAIDHGALTELMGRYGRRGD